MEPRINYMKVAQRRLARDWAWSNTYTTVGLKNGCFI
jgi:hypothetical protein